MTAAGGEASVDMGSRFSSVVLYFSGKCLIYELKYFFEGVPPPQKKKSKRIGNVVIDGRVNMVLFPVGRRSRLKVEALTGARS